MENERQDRICELERIIPAGVRRKINKSIASINAFYTGAIIGSIGLAGTSYLLFSNLPHDSATPVYLATSFFGILGAGLGVILGPRENTRMKVKTAGIENLENMNEIWEWAERKNYV